MEDGFVGRIHMDVNASVGIYFDEYAMIFLYGALKTKFERM